MLYLWAMLGFVLDFVLPERSRTRALSAAEFAWLLLWRLAYVPCFFVVVSYELGKVSTPDSHFGALCSLFVFFSPSRTPRGRRFDEPASRVRVCAGASIRVCVLRAAPAAVGER